MHDRIHDVENLLALAELTEKRLLKHCQAAPPEDDDFDAIAQIANTIARLATIRKNIAQLHAKAEKSTPAGANPPADPSDPPNPSNPRVQFSETLPPRAEPGSLPISPALQKQLVLGAAHPGNPPQGRGPAKAPVPCRK